ncbi:MAG TPA: hypothetical protein ENG50_00915 [Candidatus Altiarchaeales archaeon]|nr:hypothetical protein [Candidatus Altiarchaeales archaeon]
MTETAKRNLDRKKKLIKIFYRKFYNLIKDNPKIRRILTEKEIENGIYTLVNRIADEITVKEQKIGRELTVEEIKEIVMRILDELSSVSYIG